MTQQVKFIVGNNYGDEGKGMMCSYYTKIAKQNGHRVLNVLYNGGAQRGHTAGGHVYHCFGSGAGQGADTFCTDGFMFNPIAWWFEFKELDQKSMLYLSPNCRITTPFDVKINQLLEASRGNDRHGSCGLGIYETRYRDENNYCLKAMDFLSIDWVYHRLKRIKDKWIPRRCAELGITYENNNAYELDNFITCIEQMMKSGKVQIETCSIMKDYETIIFEGGQGVMLSENNKKDFPHLTPSVTEFRGAKYELEYLYNCTNAQFEFCKMTRPYLTRHGAGPFPGECKKEEISNKIVDKTNMPNDWQGSLRFAPCDMKWAERIRDFYDIPLNYNPFRMSCAVGITCLDQTDGKILLNKSWYPYQDLFPNKSKKLYAFFGQDTLPIIRMAEKLPE